MSDDQGMPPAGWYPDSGDPTRLRWWDGSAWADYWHDVEPEPEPEPEPAPVVQAPPPPQPFASARFVTVQQRSFAPPEPTYAPAAPTRPAPVVPSYAPAPQAQPRPAATAVIEYDLLERQIVTPTQTQTQTPTPAPSLTPASHRSEPVQYQQAPIEVPVERAPEAVRTVEAPAEPKLSSIDQARIAGGYRAVGHEPEVVEGHAYSVMRKPSQTFPGWLLAISPLWFGGGAIVAQLLLLQFNPFVVQGISALLGLLLIFGLVTLDRTRLEAQSYRSPSAWWILLPPVYFVRRVMLVGRESLGMLVTWFVSVLLLVGLLAAAVLTQGAVFDFVPDTGQGELVDETEVPSVDPLTADQRAALLTDEGTEAQLRKDLAATFQVGSVECEPFPSQASGVTTTCVVELDGIEYNAGLQVTPDAPTAFVLLGMLPVDAP